MMKWIDIDYDKLPRDFFDRVIFYEKTCPSGLLDVDDRFMMILDNGEQYFLYLKELCDRDYGRVIPFVKRVMEMPHVPGKLIMDANNAPEGWCYYYHFHHRCYMKNSKNMKIRFWK